MKHFELIVRVFRLNGGFRFPIMERACRYGINGYVSRAGDGRYRIEAEGEDEALLKFVDYCKAGPQGSPVQSVEVLEGAVVGYSSFDIR